MVLKAFSKKLFSDNSKISYGTCGMWDLRIQVDAPTGLVSRIFRHRLENNSAVFEFLIWKGF
jgi:hypothetical protein